MRKSNLAKILVAVLSFSLLLGAIVGITATAADEAEVYLNEAIKDLNAYITNKIEAQVIISK